MCESMEEAAYEGNLEELKRFCELDPNQVWTNWDAMEYAIIQNNLSCVKYLLKNGAPCGTFGCAKAAHHGHLRILAALHRHGCDWDNMTTYCAAKQGNLECLVYAVRHGCNVDRSAIKEAIERGHKECVLFLLMWLERNGYAHDENIEQWYQYALKAGLYDIADKIYHLKFEKELNGMINQIDSLDLSEMNDVTMSIKHFQI